MSTASLASIVIPVHDRAALTAQCIDAILADPPETAFEIVVSDDASGDATQAVLEGYGDPVRAVRSEQNAGFATACNAGAREAGGELLVFLNNDTLPTRGWLDALVQEAAEHPEAAVVGAKLLFPNDTVQHAGVAICQDRNPRHLYAGFPAEHPAVSKSRPFQAVTAACMLVRRDAFEAAGGFDDGYRNSLEDVDLCLRIGAAGHQVRLCHRSVLYHLESASRGRRSGEIEHSRRLFAERWGATVEPDDVRYYLEDGLISFGYRDSYPIVMEVSPPLAALPGAQGDGAKLIELQAGRLGALLRETVRLTSHVADLELETALGDSATGNGAAPPRADDGEAPDASLLTPEAVEALAGDVARIEHEILDYQTRVAAAVRGIPVRSRETEPLAPGETLLYRNVKTRLQQLAAVTVPPDAVALVVSRGDAELLDLGSTTGRHFPQDDQGNYTGYHPKDSADAIERLEALRAGGAEWLVIPQTSAWWLEHYEEFGRHLRERYELVAENPEAGMVFRLGEDS